MKYKYLMVGLWSLALLLIALAPVASAELPEYSAYMGVARQGNNLFFTILQSVNPTVPLGSIDLSRVTLEMTPKGETTKYTFSVSEDLIFRTDAAITFTLNRHDLPVSKVDSSYITGFIVIDGVDYTFIATGPGWGWGNIR